MTMPWSMVDSVLLSVPSPQVDRPIDDHARLDPPFELGGVEREQRADLDPEGDRAVAPARDRGPGVFEPAGEDIAHALAHGRRRVGAGRVLEGLELDGPIGLDHRPPP